MKVLKAGIDFIRTTDVDPQIGQEFLIKQSIATGWAKRAKVIRVTPTQVELEVTNLIPTEESNKFGTKNGLKDRREGFFADWAFRKKAIIGKKFKFFKDTCIMVGDTNAWNPSTLIQLNA